MVKECIIYSSCEEETIKTGQELGKLLNPGSIIGLIGELGAGKTIFVKGIAKGLNTQQEPNSPTFVIMNKYEGRIPLYHFDLYRISTEEELEGIGYEDFFFGDGATVVEWSDRVRGIFPEHTIEIEIKIPSKDVERQDFAPIDLENPHLREIIIRGKQPWLSSFRNTVEQALRL